MPAKLAAQISWDGLTRVWERVEVSTQDDGDGTGVRGGWWGDVWSGGPLSDALQLWQEHHSLDELHVRVFRVPVHVGVCHQQELVFCRVLQTYRRTSALQATSSGTLRCFNNRPEEAKMRPDLTGCRNILLEMHEKIEKYPLQFWKYIHKLPLSALFTFMSKNIFQFKPKSSDQNVSRKKKVFKYAVFADP